MTEHISDEYFVTREVVTYNGSALVSGEKDLVVEECYQFPMGQKGSISGVSLPAWLYFRRRRCPHHRCG